MTSRFLGVALAAVSFFSCLDVVGAEPARWQPGENVTSAVKPGVKDSRERAGADGVYGRFDGDLDIGIAAGADFSEGQTAGAIRGTLHYFSMAGVFASYADALGADDASFERLFAFGIDVRPMFVPRWVENRQRGPGFADLVIDSLSLSLGAFFASPPDQDFGDLRGFEGSLGLGLPLMARATGLWLEARGVLRWADERGGPADVAGAGLLVLGWHTIVETPLLDRGAP